MKQITDVSYIFSEIREKNLLYVDKTAYLHRLVANEARNLFFIARPRRFGKSLMISTLYAIFAGKRELFEGLAISKTDYDWQTYPVIRLSLAMIDVSTVEAARRDICGKLADSLRAAGYVYDAESSPGQNLRRAILQLQEQTGKRVVVLIDEYDAPIGDAFDDLKKVDEIRAILADIYGQIKENLGSIRFAMLTGITRFANLSVFSKLNNVVDLTAEPECATMLGYTEEELLANFSEHMHAHAQRMGLSDEDYLTQLRAWYDGYRFSPKSEARVYNPLAIAKTLVAQDTEFTATWTTTGHPTIIAQFARRNKESFQALAEGGTLKLSRMNTANFASVRAKELLYQTGYLTIDEVFPGDYVSLKVPNNEVRQDFDGFLLDIALGTEAHDAMSDAVGDALKARDFKTLFTQLQALFAGTYYSPTETSDEKVEEASYLRSLQILFIAMGFKVDVQANVVGKRADLVLEAMNAIFIFELKRSDNGTAKDAIDQIRANHYAEPYVASGRPIFLIGLVFDKTTHLLVDALAEPYAQA